MRHFHAKKGIALFLATSLMATLAPTSALAAEPGTEKEEVIYVNLNGDGSVQEINVVNIFHPGEGKEIVDYGAYQTVRNMTTTDEITLSGDTVQVLTSADKLYYEGQLESKEMPWDIDIRYYLNGKEYTAQEIAGKSGALRITIGISENENCRGSFYDNFALQTSLSLDTDKCKNIIAPDATVANVGSAKQLTYTILPGKGVDLEIKADVTDFEMDGISINGILLNLNVEVDDAELMDMVTELLDAIEQLDDGAAELYEGVSELQDRAKNDLQTSVLTLKDGADKLHNGASDLKEGGSNLQHGAADLQNGVDDLDAGIQSLNIGIGRIQDALNTLNEKSPQLVNGAASFYAALQQLQSALGGVSITVEDLSALTDASSKIKAGIGDLVSGITSLQENVSFAAYKAAMQQNGLDVEGLRQQNESAIAGLNGLIESLNSQISSLEQSGIDVTELKNQVAQLTNISALLEADNASISGTENYLNTVNGNISALLQGAVALQTSYADFDGAITDLVNKLGGLAYQMSGLSSAVNTLVSEYEKIDGGIKEYTGTVAQIVAGYSQISDGAAQLVSGSSALKTGSTNLYNGTSELLSGIVEIYDGTGTLRDGTGELDEGVAELLTGIAQLYDGAKELRDGTSEMRGKTSGMDSEIDVKIDELLEAVTGGDFEATSFVSDKNTNVDSVQFVIKTDKIQIKTAEIAEQNEAKKLTMWQKFLKLFGLYDDN